MEKNKIFISHRHSDTQSDCHRLKSDLQKVFGKDQVFLDIENLEPGIKFAEAIEITLAQSKVVLVVIGPDWLHASNEKGEKRLFDPKDWVRREIAASLESPSTRVIPVLVKDANIPDEDELPEDLKPLTQLQVAEITTKRWDYDLGELTKVLAKLVPTRREPYMPGGGGGRPIVPKPPQPKSWWAKNYLWLLAGLIGLFILIGILSPTEEVYPITQDESLVENQEANPIQTEPQTNPGPAASGTLSESGDPRINNPNGTQIYDTLSFQEKTPAFSGKWWLFENGIRSGYFQISQQGDEFSFTYYLFDVPVGSGTGYYEDYSLVSETFTMTDSPGNYGFYFEIATDGQTWIGQTFANQITSQSYLQKD